MHAAEANRLVLSIQRPHFEGAHYMLVAYLHKGNDCFRLPIADEHPAVFDALVNGYIVSARDFFLALHPGIRIEIEHRN